MGDLSELVRERYAARALTILQGGSASCCGEKCGGAEGDPISGGLYGAKELAAVPEEAAQASLGCGNPLALARLQPGEVVLDLGSGGGMDVLLAAQRVGPSGRAYGVDMTEEMLELARRNAAKAGVANAEFLKGRIEELPLPDASVDVVMSNCVINLSTDKCKVLREAFRVLKPGGQLMVADVVVDGPVPEELRRQVELWVGCIAGALERQEYEQLLQLAGFQEIAIKVTRHYQLEDMGDAAVMAWLEEQPQKEQERLRRAFFSAVVTAVRPA